MNLYFVAIVFQVLAILAFVGALTDSKPNSSPDPHPAPGDVYNSAHSMDSSDPVVATKTVLAVKDGYVQCQVRYWIPGPTERTNVLSMDVFLFHAERVLPDKNPFNTPEPEKKP